MIVLVLGFRNCNVLGFRIRVVRFVGLSFVFAFLFDFALDKFRFFLGGRGVIEILYISIWVMRL